MNTVILIGNLANDPEMRSTQSGIKICSFRLAVQRNFVNGNGVREADFINIIAWRETAELCGKYLSKGRKVAIDGRLQSRSYDAQDGSKRYVTEVVCNRVEFLPSGSRASAPGDEDAPPPAGDNWAQVPDDELPF